MIVKMKVPVYLQRCVGGVAVVSVCILLLSSRCRLMISFILWLLLATVHCIEVLWEGGRPVASYQILVVQSVVSYFTKGVFCALV
jgi:hypothetical protein